MSKPKAPYTTPSVTVRTREGIAELQGTEWVFYKTNGKGRRYRAELPARLLKQLKEAQESEERSRK